MRVLLDEQLDHRLKHNFNQDVEVCTVQEMGWKGKKNGTLLRLAQAEFDVFITMDRGIEHQHNFSEINIVIIILSAKTNRYTDVAPLISELNAVLPTLQVGQILHIGKK